MNTKQFTKKYYVDRKGTDCIKWDNPEVKNKLPMFIADMDFKTDEKIIKCLNQRISHGAYGYTFLPKDYNATLIKWYKKRNKFTLNADWIRFSKGAVDGLYQLIYALTNEKDPILITTPVYHPFSVAINTTKRKLVESKLTRTNGLFTFDYVDLEKKFKENKVKMMILCSPHNPLGRVWKKEELSKLFALTHKYHVLVVSDEVHSDIIMEGNKFIPSLSFKEYQNEIVSLNTLSKTFSLAIFAHCHVIIPNEKLRAKFDAYQKARHLDPVNALNALPTYYGMKYCEEWLDDANAVVKENYEYFLSQIGEYCYITPLQGTYLIFVDFSKYTKDAYKFLYDKCDIVANAGDSFAKGYGGWARINLATSLANVEKACEAIKKALNK